MPAKDLFFPMFALFLWTFLVALRNLQVRIAAIRRRELSNRYFELFQGGAPSPAVMKAQNHLRNLTEFPPLFYIASLLVIALARTDNAFVVLAWLYVALRIGHSIVHLSFNAVPTRFLFFFGSNLVLLAIWLRLAWQLA
jgi:hypothetical protein